jgi:hypothetical protein
MRLLNRNSYLIFVFGELLKRILGLGFRVYGLGSSDALEDMFHGLGSRVYGLGSKP